MLNDLYPANKCLVCSKNSFVIVKVRRLALIDSAPFFIYNKRKTDIIPFGTYNSFCIEEPQGCSESKMNFYQIIVKKIYLGLSVLLIKHNFSKLPAANLAYSGTLNYI